MLGPLARWAQGPPGSRPLQEAEVEELVSLLASGVRASRVLGRRGRLLLSTSSSFPGGAPPRGSRILRPLRRPAEATVTPPLAQNPHPPTPPQGRVGGRGRGRQGEEGGVRMRGAPPRRRPTAGLRSLPRPQRRGMTARVREAASVLPAKAPPHLPALSRSRRRASRFRRFPSSGRLSLGSGAGRRAAVGGAARASLQLGAGRGPEGASGFRPWGKGRD